MPSAVVLKEFSDTSRMTYQMSIDEWSPSASELPSQFVPSGLSDERCHYLLTQIRELCRSGTEDLVCSSLSISLQEPSTVIQPGPPSQLQDGAEPSTYMQVATSYQTPEVWHLRCPGPHKVNMPWRWSVIVTFFIISPPHSLLPLFYLSPIPFLHSFDLTIFTSTLQSSRLCTPQFTAAQLMPSSIFIHAAPAHAY